MLPDFFFKYTYEIIIIFSYVYFDILYFPVEVMKKYFLGCMLWLCGIFSLWGISFAQLDNTINPFTDPTDTGSADQIWLVWTDQWQWDSAVNVVKWFINWTLGILALIALIVLLRWGFQMVTAAWNEDRYGKWRTILKQAAIWLAMIWLARFIVSLIFWLINLLWVNAEWGAWTDT